MNETLIVTLIIGISIALVISLIGVLREFDRLEEFLGRWV